MSTTYYGAQSAQGSGDGSSPANAFAISWVNTAGNWSATPGTSGKLSPGDTFVLVGNITTQIVTQGPGLVNNPITFDIPQGCSMTKDVWEDDGAILVTHDYIKGTSSTAVLVFGAGHWMLLFAGVISNTDNGTNLGHQQTSTGILVRDCRGFSAEKLSIQNLYVRVPGSDPAATCTGISVVWNGGFVPREVSVVGCQFHDMSTGFFMDYGPGCTDVEMSKCEAYNCNWGGAAGSHGATATLDRLTVEGNYFHDWTCWDAPTDIGIHHNGFYAYAESGGGLLKSVTYNGNQVGPNFSASLSGYNASTSGLFVSGLIQGPVIVSNNLFVNNGIYGGPSDGLIFLWQNQDTDGVYIVANNTFIGGNGANSINFINTSTSTMTIAVLNNILSGPDLFASCLYNTNVALTADHNSGFGMVSNPFKWASGGSGSGISLSAWKTATGQDADFLTSDPTLDTNYSPNTGSPLIAAGANLTSIFDTDILNRIRPTPATAWCIGAFEGPWLPDALTLNQTANASPVTELYQRCPLGATVPADEVIHHAGNYPRQPDKDYVYAKSGTPQKNAYVFPGTLTLGQAQAARAAL